MYDHTILGNASHGDVMLTVDGTHNPRVNFSTEYDITYTYEDDGGVDVPQMFNVDATTGIITINRDVDITSSIFQGIEHAATDPTLFNGFFRVVATDNQGQTTSCNVVIELVPASSRPAFPEGGYHGSVLENATSGTAVLNASGTFLGIWVRHCTCSRNRCEIWDCSYSVLRLAVAQCTVYTTKWLTKYASSQALSRCDC